MADAPFTIKTFLQSLRDNTRDDLAPMIDVLESNLDAIQGHKQNPWLSAEEILQSVVGAVDMLANFPEGVDNTLANQKLSAFGINNLGLTRYPTGDDDEKGAVAYLIYTTEYFRRVFDIAQKLGDEYGVQDAEDRLALAEQADHSARWNFDSNVESFFAALAQTPAGDIADRIEAAAANKKAQPAPKPPQPF